MSPTGPAPDRPVAGIPAYLVWRGLVVLALVLSSAAVALAAVLYSRGLEYGEQNRATLCGIGSFLTGSPLVRVAGVDRQAFIGQLLTTEAFLRDLAELDCPNEGFGRSVTAEEIERQLEAIRRRIAEERSDGSRQRARKAATRLLDEPAAVMPGATATGPGSAPAGGTTTGESPPSDPPGSGQPPGDPDPPQPPSPEPPPEGPGLLEETIDEACELTSPLGVCL